jgi:NAD(P)H-dependent flavin oxidoreductase YrpB (nitropropane dioxygenase family)
MRRAAFRRVPIVMAGGVWNLKEWEHWIDNPELGQIVFQFGTRPLAHQESPIPEEWKQRLMTLEEGDVLLHSSRPTGFYSSAVRTPFPAQLEARSHRQIAFTKEEMGDHSFQLDVGVGTGRITG